MTKSDISNLCDLFLDYSAQKNRFLRRSLSTGERDKDYFNCCGIVDGILYCFDSLDIHYNLFYDNSLTYVNGIEIDQFHIKKFISSK